MAHDPVPVWRRMVRRSCAGAALRPREDRGEGFAEWEIALNAWGLSEWPAEQQGEKIPTRCFEDRSRGTVRNRRGGFDGTVGHADPVGRAVRGHEQPGAFKACIAMVQCPPVEPLETHRKRHGDEWCAPIIQIHPKVRFMHFHLGQPEQCEVGERDGAEIGVVRRFVDLATAVRGIDCGPRLGEHPAVQRQGVDHVA